MLTAEYLKEVLHYDPMTGIFTWKRSGKGRPVGEVAGTVNQDGYIRIRVGGKKYMAHRLAWLWVHGQWPHGELDHKNNVRSDNRISELREANRSGNCANRKCRSSSASGVKGVTDYRGKFKVSVKGKYLGLFVTLEEARTAYFAEAVKQYGEFARAA